MRINLVCVEDGLDNIGFRKFSAFVRKLQPEVGIHYVTTGNLRGLVRTIIMQGQANLDDGDIERIAGQVADCDLFGISSMTQYSSTAKQIIAAVRRRNPEAMIVWGGIHAIIQPEDAILHADAVSTGEGEFAFEQLIDALKEGRDYHETPGFWFNTPNGVKRNLNLPLMTPEAMDSLPLLTYQDGELFYERGRGFRPIRPLDFANFAGLAYNAVWSIGCPLKCTYCGNTKFIEYDAAYRRIRHPSVEYMVAEIKAARKKHPHISTVVFHDDSFMAIPYVTLELFAEVYRKEIGLPFAVFGVIPNYVRDDKIQVLLEAGLNRVRMGIQSGSERVLKFYDRPTPLSRIREGTDVLSRYPKYMIPSAYDIILDNPIETREDTLATTDLLYEMSRPYTLNIYSLRVIPNTELAKNIKELGIDLEDIRTNYAMHRPTLGNLLVYMHVIWRMPRSWYERLRRHVRPSHEPQREYYVLLLMLRTLYLTKRAFSHIRFMDFTTLTGWPVYMLARTGFVRFWHRHLLRKFQRPHGATPLPPQTELAGD